PSMSSTAADSLTFWCTCPPGLEDLARDEALESLASFDVRSVEASRGRLVCNIAAPLADGDSQNQLIRSVLNLRMPANHFLVFYECCPFDLSESLDRLIDLVPQANWQLAMSAWRTLFYEPDGRHSEIQNVGHEPLPDYKFTRSKPYQAGDSQPKLQSSEDPSPNDQAPSGPKVKDPSKLSFRCTCYRAGSGHSFQSMEVAAAVGAAVQDYFGWNVDLKNYDIEVVIWIEGPLVRICLSLNRLCMDFRGQLVDVGSTALRSTIAAGMIRLCKPRSGEIICDCMCGSGSIPLEAWTTHQNAYHLAGDCHPVAIDKCAANIANWCQRWDQRSPVELIRWNLCQFPVRPGTVDVFLADLPFGKRLGSRRENASLYPAALSAMAKSCVPVTGRACLLSADRKNLSRAINAHYRRYPSIIIINMNHDSSNSGAAGGNVKRKQIYKVVLTGGPCGGKTTSLARITNFFQSLGWKVYRISEVAYTFMSGGMVFTELNEETIYDFQKNLIFAMMQIEKTFDDLANADSNDKVMIVCDRGNAIQVDDQVANAWVGHPYYDVIDNSTDFEDKLRRMLQCICDRIGIDVSDRLSLKARKLKFLVGKVDWNHPCLENIKMHRFQVENRFLAGSVSCSEHSRIRSRQSTDQDFTYVHTTRHITTTADGRQQVVETKRPLSSHTYQLLLRAQSSRDHLAIYKSRCTFLWDDQYYQLDLFDKDRCPQLLAVSEVSGESRYRLFNLATPQLPPIANDDEDHDSVSVQALHDCEADCALLLSSAAAAQGAIAEAHEDQSVTSCEYDFTQSSALLLLMNDSVGSDVIKEANSNSEFDCMMRCQMRGCIAADFDADRQSCHLTMFSARPSPSQDLLNNCGVLITKSSPKARLWISGQLRIKRRFGSAAASSLTTNYSTTGRMLTVTIATSGCYRIKVFGAKGGSSAHHGKLGGNGASATGHFFLDSGTRIGAVVGQAGGSVTRPFAAGGGGGGSFVYRLADGGLLLAAGGGGGASRSRHGLPGHSGPDGTGTNSYYYFMYRRYIRGGTGGQPGYSDQVWNRVGGCGAGWFGSAASQLPISGKRSKGRETASSYSKVAAEPLHQMWPRGQQTLNYTQTEGAVAHIDDFICDNEQLDIEVKSRNREDQLNTALGEPPQHRLEHRQDAEPEAGHRKAPSTRRTPIIDDEALTSFCVKLMKRLILRRLCDCDLRAAPISRGQDEVLNPLLWNHVMSELLTAAVPSSIFKAAFANDVSTMLRNLMQQQFADKVQNWATRNGRTTCISTVRTVPAANSRSVTLASGDAGAVAAAAERAAAASGLIGAHTGSASTEAAASSGSARGGSVAASTEAAVAGAALSGAAAGPAVGQTAASLAVAGASPWIDGPAKPAGAAAAVAQQFFSFVWFVETRPTIDSSQSTFEDVITIRIRTILVPFAGNTCKNVL
uniref:THUMP domain-containing protein n=1 Tax=Macrostomum lignano TaxID=282301 RepID=A0A1I8IJQ7_9PLAT